MCEETNLFEDYILFNIYDSEIKQFQSIKEAHKIMLLFMHKN